MQIEFLSHAPTAGENGNNSRSRAKAGHAQSEPQATQTELFRTSYNSENRIIYLFNSENLL